MKYKNIYNNSLWFISTWVHTIIKPKIIIKKTCIKNLSIGNIFQFFCLFFIRTVFFNIFTVSLFPFKVKNKLATGKNITQKKKKKKDKIIDKYRVRHLTFFN